VVTSVVVASSVASVAMVSLELLLRDFLTSSLSNKLNILSKELLISHLSKFGFSSGFKISVTSSVASVVSVVVTSVVVASSVASDVVVGLILLLRDLFTFILSSNNDILESKEFFILHLLDVSLSSSVKISVASSVASSIASVVVGVVVASSVASVMPVGFILFLSNGLLFFSNFTSFLMLKSEELLVTDGLDVNFLGTEISVTSSVASAVSVAVASVVVTSAVASVAVVVVVLLFRDFDSLAFIRRHFIVDHIDKLVFIE
jgi:hypothetical protein